MESLLEKCDICADQNPMRTTVLVETQKRNLFICRKCVDSQFIEALAKMPEKAAEVIEYKGWQ